MTERIQKPGIDVLTDNWLLQNAAGLVSGDEDPSEEASWLQVLPGIGLTITDTLRGAIQVECLMSLLGQIVLNELIYLMPGWTDSWMGKSSALDGLRARDVIGQVTYDEPTKKRRRVNYLDEWCLDPPIQRAHQESLEAWARGESTVTSQIIGGTASYLAIADETKLPYAPHPVRGLFMNQTLYSASWRSDGLVKFHELVDESRVKLTRLLRPTSSVTQLTYSVSSVAMLCLLESSSSAGPLEIACQLREEREVKSLRSTLLELSLAMADSDARTAMATIQTGTPLREMSSGATFGRPPVPATTRLPSADWCV